VGTLDLISEIEEKYKHAVALTAAGIEEYRKAGREVREAFATAMISGLLALVFFFLRIDVPFAPLLASAPLLPSIWKIAKRIATYSDLKKRVEEELPFLIVASASVSKTGLELAEALKFSSNSRSMKGIKVLGERFVRLSELLGMAESLRFLLRMTGKKARGVLVDYIASLGSGAASIMLKERAREVMKDAEAEVEKGIQSRTMLSVLMIVLLGMAPSLLIGFQNLQSFGSTAYESGSSSLAYALLFLTAIPLAVKAVPEYPPTMRIVFSEKLGRLLNILAAFGSALLFVPILDLLLRGKAGEFSAHLLVFSTLSILSTFPSFLLTVKAAFAFPVEKVVENMLDRVRVWRNLMSDVIIRGDAKLRRGARPWIFDYIADMIPFFKTIGDIDPSTFQIFAEFVYEGKRHMRKFSQILLVVAATAALSPYMSAIMLGLGGTPFPSQVATAYLGTLAYGFVAERIALGHSRSTVLPSISSIIFALTLHI